MPFGPQRHIPAIQGTLEPISLSGLGLDVLLTGSERGVDCLLDGWTVVVLTVTDCTEIVNIECRWLQLPSLCSMS